jgi:hypothetical protein
MLDSFISGDISSHLPLFEILMSGEYGDACDHAGFALLRRWFEVHASSADDDSLATVISPLYELLFTLRPISCSLHELFRRYGRRPSFQPLWGQVLDRIAAMDPAMSLPVLVALIDAVIRWD